MAKLAQVISYTKRLYTFDEYHRYLEKYHHLEITKIYSTCNREQNDITEQKDLTADSIMNALVNNQSFCCEFLLDNRYETGYRIKWGGNNVYEITLWLNMCCVPYIRFESMNRKNIDYYSHPIRFVTEVIHKDDLLLAGIGLDATLEYFESNDNMIENSEGIIIWIAPNEIEPCINDNYYMENRDRFLIYTKLSKKTDRSVNK